MFMLKINSIVFILKTCMRKADLYARDRLFHFHMHIAAFAVG
ncbi:hypothetical protein B4110_1968 [Parageobacillus toebii]|uniref:Uncharacterized protein n=1 Tax=Parageobacillus toebii TaxID=153151 RepID=A0A150N4N1_9BACL|nr:hypothetical protein B4110_1968 [Parageobacillus toebii]